MFFYRIGCSIFKINFFFIICYKNNNILYIISSFVHRSLKKNNSIEKKYFIFSLKNIKGSDTRRDLLDTNAYKKYIMYIYTRAHSVIIIIDLVSSFVSYTVKGHETKISRVFVCIFHLYSLASP